jgi:DNA-binding GntR family transcriptional regulator
MKGAATSRAPRGAEQARAGQTLHRVSKGDQVYSALKRAIISGELPPGISIDKTGLCHRFGVSRLPVTTAINRLAYERLVVIEPQRGSFVARIELRDVVQWMTARRALEIEVVGQCARTITPSTAGRLEQNLLYQQAAIGGSDFAGFLELDVAFHKGLTLTSGLNRIGEVLDTLRSHLDRVRCLLLPEPGRLEGTLREHQAILDAVRKQDVRGAERAMKAHLETVLQRLVAFEKTYPDFFGT